MVGADEQRAAFLGPVAFQTGVLHLKLGVLTKRGAVVFVNPVMVDPAAFFCGKILHHRAVGHGQRGSVGPDPAAIKTGIVVLYRHLIQRSIRVIGINPTAIGAQNIEPAQIHHTHAVGIAALDRDAVQQHRASARNFIRQQHDVVGIFLVAREQKRLPAAARHVVAIQVAAEDAGIGRHIADAAASRVAAKKLYAGAEVKGHVARVGSRDTHTGKVNGFLRRLVSARCDVDARSGGASGGQCLVQRLECLVPGSAIAAGGHAAVHIERGGAKHFVGAAVVLCIPEDAQNIGRNGRTGYNARVDGRTAALQAQAVVRRAELVVGAGRVGRVDKKWVLRCVARARKTAFDDGMGDVTLAAAPEIWLIRQPLSGRIVHF